MQAKDALKELMRRRINKVMVAALDHAEDTMYNDTFDKFRSRILDCGNDQMKLLTDDFEKFEIEWGTKTEILFLKKEEVYNGNK